MSPQPFLQKSKIVLALTLAFLASVSLTLAEEGTWKTAFVKRGFCGLSDANWSGGLGATHRMRTPLQFDGTKVRVFLRGDSQNDESLTKMALVKGADDDGKITGTPFPILFGGSEKLILLKSVQTFGSDEMPVAITRGTWYIEDQYSCQKFPYAFEVDQGFYEAGDNFAKEKLANTLKFRTSGLYRVDVFTTDPRSAILCCGDSITQGYNSTPNTDHRYPAILGKLLNRPVLNLGQNGDTIQEWGRMESLADELPGVDTVILLVGINDIINAEKINSVPAYAGAVQRIIADCHQRQRKIHIGTILPAGGFANFDSDPGKEILRQAFNAWIRQGNGADGVIDFDAALADPTHPTKLKAEYQSDWLHPNDAGYQKMAETAAQALTGK